MDDTAAQQYQQTQDRYNADYELYLQGKDTPTYGKGYKARASRSSGYSYRETAEDRRRSQPSFHEGQEAGHSVGLDRQITENRSKRIG